MCLSFPEQTSLRNIGNFIILSCKSTNKRAIKRPWWLCTMLHGVSVRFCGIWTQRVVQSYLSLSSNTKWVQNGLKKFCLQVRLFTCPVPKGEVQVYRIGATDKNIKRQWKWIFKIYSGLVLTLCIFERKVISILKQVFFV